MSYTADSFAANEQPTTSKWNELWANDAALRDGSGLAWGASAVLTGGPGSTSFTFTLTGSSSNPTLGNSTTVSRYIQLGRLVAVNYQLTIGSTFVAGSGSYRFALPIAASSNQALNSTLMAVGNMLDSSAPETALVAGSKLISTTTLEIEGGKAGGFGAIGSAFPFVWAVGDLINFWVIYEV